ncbi:MAG: glycosyltransferase, partial [Bdellovibrionales bacterium]|nr:glycosyltransferase [Bdellovibrionales bacterium]
MLAPQPFYQERGTPIAVRLALEVLAKRPETEMTVLTYDEGKKILIPRVQQERSFLPQFLRPIRPGISWQKLVADIFFLFRTFSLLVGRRKEQFDLIHAVEESVFIAYIAKLIFGIPYIYDMDSSLSLQVSERWKWSRLITPFMRLCERIVIRRAVAVVPVCDALAKIAFGHGARDLEILHDISLLDFEEAIPQPLSLREECQVPLHLPLAVYVGNLEPYQGIDLLLESIALHRLDGKGSVIVIGGTEEHISFYRQKADSLGIASSVSFTGPKPVTQLPTILNEADILLSPRTQGNNTPMKIYSYLHSGKAILATRL